MKQEYWPEKIRKANRIKKTKSIIFEDMTNDEIFLRSIFTDLKMEFVNEHTLWYNYGEELFFEFDDLNRTVGLNAGFIKDKFKTDFDKKLISELTAKLLAELFHIDNLDGVYYFNISIDDI